MHTERAPDKHKLFIKKKGDVTYTNIFISCKSGIERTQRNSVQDVSYDNVTNVTR